jgi:methionine-gamma-lyase
MTHSTYTPEERAACGISDGLVRLSIGLEDIADVLADIVQALDKVQPRAAALAGVAAVELCADIA